MAFHVTSVFVSATSGDLGSYRQAVDKALRAPDMHVIAQEIIRPEYREVSEVLRQVIGPCDAVICLVGFRYGREPQDRPPDKPRRSYTQLEFEIAAELGKPVYLFLADEQCAFDPAPPEPEELQELQRAWREVVKQRTRGVRRTFSSRDDLMQQVGRIRWDQPPAPPQAGKHCNLPYATLGTLFKGRDQFLQSLGRNLESAANHVAAVVTPQALHGLGGVGKTRLAIEYGWRHETDYSALLFVTADSRENLQRNLAGLCGALVLPEREAKEQEVQVTAALRWLESHPSWFLVLDNVDTEPAAREVEQLLVRLRQGHVVITSRLSNWSAAVQPLELDVLDETASVAFLLDRTDAKRKKQPADAEDVAALARELDGLALALEQAGAYIGRHRCSLGEYLTQWWRQDATVRQWFDERLMQYPRSVATTWETTLAQLDVDARDMLRLVAWLAPEPIPVAMFNSTETEVPTNASATLAQLADYSLIKWDTETSQRAFRVHRLVQDVTRLRTPGEERKQWIERMLLLVDAYAPIDPDDVRTWHIWDLLRPHAQSIILHTERHSIAKPASRLMNQLGILLKEKCLFTEAETLYRRALAIDEQACGRDHPTVATVLSNLAEVLLDTNRRAEAERLMRRALAIVEQAYGPDHPTIATCLNNWAQVLQATNRLAEAEPLMRRALTIAEQVNGPDHPTVGIRLNNLAQLLQDTKRVAEAEPLMRRALAIAEQVIGPDHPTVALRLNNLARLLQDTNRLAEAEPLTRRALTIDEQTYGPDHPAVAIGLNNLAMLLQDTNRLAEAEPLMRRALAIDEQAYGPQHPSVARDLNNLAHLLQATNRLAEAEPLMRRALAIDEVAYAPDHPEVAVCLNNLAQLLQATNRLAEAEPLSRRVLEIFATFTRTTGHEHPHLRAAVGNYEQLLAAMGLEPSEMARHIQAIMGEPGDKPA